MEKSEKEVIIIKKKVQKRLKIVLWVAIGAALMVPLFIVGEFMCKKFHKHRFHYKSLELESKNSFPSVSLCQVFNGEKNWDLSEKYFGTERDKRIDDYLTEMSFFTGACYTCELCSKEVDCPRNVSEILLNFRASCSDLLKNCSWNDEPFDCCEGFQPLETETGVCFSINSALTAKKYGKRLHSDKETGPGKLKMALTEDMEIFIHHPNDVPYAYGDKELRDTILLGSTKGLVIKTTEITNDQSIHKMPISERGCKFPHEQDEDSLYDRYSVSTCEVDCYNAAQLKLCNCTHHLMPRPGYLNIPQCDLKGLECLTDNFMKLSELRKKCTGCLPACEKQKSKIVFNSYEEMGNEEGTDITVLMIAMPTHVRTRKAFGLFE